MTANPLEGKSQQKPGFATAATPKELMSQLVSMLNEDSGSSVEERLEELRRKVDSLAAKVESAEADGGLAGVGPDAASMGDLLKRTITSVLLESGFLEKFVTSIVTKKIAESGGGGGDVTAQARELSKQFLTENLGTIFQSQIKPQLEAEIQQWMSSEAMKVLLDDKFRAVTLYLKTDVIPTAVRQAMNNTKA